MANEDETVVRPSTTAPTSADVADAEDLTGQVIAGRYEVLEVLGAGGMGTVYRARDRELDEIVALKALQRGLLDGPEALERFRREVKLARRVTHRNVARTFDIGETGADKFLTMEFVDGPTLGQVIRERGGLEVAEALRVAVAITEALAVAHAAGVIHRDLKPDNVMLARDGRVVVMDFGIATAGAFDAGHAEAEMIVGTPAYMSPEQVEGASLDPRSDLYALGLVIHEMLTGRRALAGVDLTSVETRLRWSPPDLAALRPGLPPALLDATRRLLARAPDDRPVDAEAARALLTAAAAGPATSALLARPGTQSLAVYPLRWVGPAVDEWIAQGFADDLQDSLCMVRDLRVKARAAAQDGDDARTYGRRLAVDLVVDGSVRRHGEGLRAQMRLIAVHDGEQVWSCRHDAALGDLLALSERIADELARAAGAVMTQAPTSARATVDPEAIELYLRARAAPLAFITDNPAVDLLDRALAKAPREPRILAARAIAGVRAMFRAGGNFQARLASARESAERAVELAPELAEAWVALAHVRNASNDSPGAVRAVRRALTIGPSVVEGHEMAARLLSEADRFDDATRLIEQARWLEPGLRYIHIELVRIHALRGDIAATTRELATMRANHPLQDAIVAPRASLWLGQQLYDPSPLPAGLDPLSEAFADNMRAAFAARALSAEARVKLAGIVEQAPPGSRMRRFFGQMLCEILIAVGDQDGAEAALAASIAAGLEDLAWIDRCRLLAPLREAPSFAAHRAAVSARAAAVTAAWDEA